MPKGEGGEQGLLMDCRGRDVFPLPFSEGVSKGGIDLERLVRITCLNMAKIFGIFPRKGILARWSDADILIADRAGETSISAPILHMDADWSSREE